MILAFYTESRIYYQHNKQYNKNLLYLPTLEGAQGTRIHTDSHWPDIVRLCFLTCAVGLALTATRFKSSIQTCHGISRPQDRLHHRQTNTQTGRRTDGQTVGQTDTQKEGQTDRQRPTNEQTHKEADRQQTHIWRDVSTNKQTNNHRLTQHWSRGI